MNRYLVTGGAGFIGSNLCARLLTHGHEVICVDDFSSSSPTNIAHLNDSPRFHSLTADITEGRLDLDVDVDAIFHLACPASPIHYQRNPVRTLKTAVVGSLHVLELAHDLNAPVLLTSTSEVYGDPLIHPQSETYYGNVNTVGPRACYDEGKRAAETLFADFRRHHRAATKIVRVFNTYGPGMAADDGRVVSNFVMQALTGEPLTVYGDGRQTRSFCYVDDLVDGLILAMASDIPGPINLGNPDEITVTQLAVTVANLSGVDVLLSLGELPADDPRQRKPDISYAQQTLGWTPSWTLQDGLSRTIDWFRKALHR